MHRLKHGLIDSVGLFSPFYVQLLIENFAVFSWEKGM
jgi:hypothetical protein